MREAPTNNDPTTTTTTLAERNVGFGQLFQGSSHSLLDLFSWNVHHGAMSCGRRLLSGALRSHNCHFFDRFWGLLAGCVSVCLAAVNSLFVSFFSTAVE